MPSRHADAVVKVLLDRYGQTYAGEASLRLRDTPGPLYRLLALATMLGDGAAPLLDRWRGDLRRLRDQGTRGGFGRG